MNSRWRLSAGNLIFNCQHASRIKQRSFIINDESAAVGPSELYAARIICALGIKG